MKIKKLPELIIAALLTLALILILSIASVATKAFADGEGTLRIHKLDSIGVVAADREESAEYWENADDGLYYRYLEDATFEVYHIGSFTVEGGYSAINGLVDLDGDPVSLSATTDASSINTTGLTAVYTGTTGVPPGHILTTALDQDKVYLIKETSPPPGVNRSADFIITVPLYVDGQWIYEIDAYPKNVFSQASISKTMTGANAGNIINSTIGEEIEYIISVGVPNDFESGIYNKFAIIDTASPYLLLDQSTIKIEHISKASGQTTTWYDAENTIDLAYFDIATTTDGDNNNILTLALKDTAFDQPKNGDNFTITYRAEIDEGAASVPGGLKNRAVLDLGLSDPVGPDDPDPDPKVKINSYGIKKLGQEQPLAAAKFVMALKDNDAYTYLAYDFNAGTWTSAANRDAATVFETEATGDANDELRSEAILQFWNLEKNTKYYLIEIEAPQDYILLPDAIEIEADANSTNAVYASYSYDKETELYVYVEDVGYSTLITNIHTSEYPGGSLPETGGIGAYWFLLIGAVLVTVAAVLYLYSRKKGKQQANV